MISLNIGWNADFKILLDSDRKGKEQQERYIDQYHLNPANVLILPNDNTEIENYLDSAELLKLYNIVNHSSKSENISKKEIATLFALVADNKAIQKDIVNDEIFGTRTMKNFRVIFEMLNIE